MVAALALLILTTQLGALTAEAAATVAMFADVLTETARLHHSDGPPTVFPFSFNDDSFGYSVAMSGNTVLVGAHRVGLLNRGSAYVFERNQGGANAWGEVKKLTACGAPCGFPTAVADPADQFGAGVALDGDTAVVGAPGWEADIGGDPKINKGGAYIFERNAGGAGNWGQVHFIPGPVSDKGGFGLAVALEGDVVAIAAVKDGNLGSVTLYGRNVGGAGAWGAIKKILPPPAPLPNSQFGIDVAMSGDTLLVGQLTNTRVHFFERDMGGAGNWGLTQTVGGPEQFGRSVDIDGNTAVVGAPTADTGPFLNNGVAYVLLRQGATWVLPANGQLNASDEQTGAQLGSSVAVTGDIVFAGAASHDLERDNAGAGYIFSRNAGGTDNWGEIHKVLPDPPGSTNFVFGSSAAASEGRILVGAPFNQPVLPTNNPGGFAYVYDIALPTSNIRFFVGD